MFAKRKQPETLSPAELDSYLEEGWYRTGQAVFTTHFLMFGYKSFYSAIWVRLPLDGFSFSKNNRKLLSKNKSRFRWEFREAELGPEAEALYQSYSAHFPAKLAPSLQDALLENNHRSIFRTMEFLAWDGEQLVAASYFDLGENSIASILGFYHPDYARYSLGYFTMLMEVAYGLEHGYRYFYPGYVVPGYPRFDYKLRVGPMEYFDLRARGWLPHALLSPEHIPFSKIQRNLQSLSELLHQHQITHELRENLLFHLNLVQDIPFLDYPLMLFLDPGYDFFNAEQEVIVFNPYSDQFQYLLCQNAGGVYVLSFDGNAEDLDDDFLGGVPIDIIELITTWETISEIPSALKAAGY